MDTVQPVVTVADEKERDLIRFSSLSRYLIALSKSLDPRIRLTSKALAIIELLIWDTASALMEIANVSATNDHRITMLPRDIELAVKVLLPGELKKTVPQAMTHALLQFFTAQEERSKKGPSAKRKTHSEIAGLILPIARVDKMMRMYLATHSTEVIRLGSYAALFLTVTLENLAAKIIQISDDEVVKDERELIQPRDILRALQGDKDLQTIFNCAITEKIREQIQASAIPKQAKKKAGGKKTGGKKALQSAKPRSKASKSK